MSDNDVFYSTLNSLQTWQEHLGLASISLPVETEFTEAPKIQHLCFCLEP